MKQRIAEDRENPPHNREGLHRKALEHEQNGRAAFLATATLKAVLSTGRTKADQIALMRHYVLEFSQSASRNARAANRLEDDDPQKGKIDQKGASASVVAVLSGILADVAPSDVAAAPLSMASRPVTCSVGVPT
jgi:hypothetical protein